MPTPNKLTKEQKDEAIDRYKSGASQSELARVYGVSQSSIRYLIITRGVEPRPKSAVPTERIIRLRSRGYSYAQIARIVGLSPSSIRARYHRHEAKKDKRTT